MSNNFITFNIRREKELIELKLETPSNISGFIETLKNELKLEETDEIVILYPGPDGKMTVLQSDDDIEFLKKTKLSYNVVTQEIYCNVELVVIVVHKLPNDTNAELMVLSKKIENLTFQVNKLSDEFTMKIDENKTNTFSAIRSILTEYLQIDSGNKLKDSLGDEDLKESKPGVYVRPKKTKKDKEKLSTTTSGSNNNSSTIFENIKSDTPKSLPNVIPKDIDVLLEMLVADGFTNTIQNIIVLKRFDNDYEKAKTYLKSSIA
ncbi:uncharacterized protein LOC112593618 [Melanaphis sacchari]|uniref:uncharacterized protein LOC112593618 n=1 Tax=Melanaphis sacchari TaxID=742174 RepID=UPI000DC15493|nr:uncharacterized protein LOC112593618 [Melanaphis sacchari]XP_025193899.1 uncharacterized protein LOC112593618 [Melanaphis sacchari]XP_025193907.1 uncharacterized protein LOC112593618 [Melanaphis sacchari]